MFDNLKIDKPLIITKVLTIWRNANCWSTKSAVSINYLPGCTFIPYRYLTYTRFSDYISIHYHFKNFGMHLGLRWKTSKEIDIKTYIKSSGDFSDKRYHIALNTARQKYLRK